jgi:TPR repeat protein
MATYIGRRRFMDDREAARLYKLAADQGNALAQISLGEFYENGRGGLPRDDREAARLFKLAADQGNSDSRHGRSCDGRPRRARSRRWRVYVWHYDIDDSTVVAAAG